MKSTYQIKYWSGLGKSGCKFIMADNRNEAMDLFHERFGKKLKIRKVNKYINHEEE